jgi:hypothetical protein
MDSISIKGSSNACASFPCYNGGSCTPAGASFLCTCKPPYIGPQCLGTGAGTGMIRNRYCFLFERMSFII